MKINYVDYPGVGVDVQTSSTSLTREETIISIHYHTFCHCKRVFFPTHIAEILFFQVAHYPPPAEMLSQVAEWPSQLCGFIVQGR